MASGSRSSPVSHGRPKTGSTELEAATSLYDLAALPGNALEPLRGDRKGQYSIRIKDQCADQRASESTSGGRLTEARRNGARESDENR